MPDISIRPSEMVEGAAVPIDTNYTVKEARFALFDYQGKAPTTTAARLVLVDDAGVEYTQHYSVSDPSRFTPSRDGKSLVAVGAASSLSKSSNFHILMANIVNAGFPENRVSSDISVLDDMYAYWIGEPEPKRQGLRPITDDRERVIPVPSKIHRLPWEKAPAPRATTSRASMAQPAQVAQPRLDVAAAAVEFIQKVVADQGGSATRQDVAAKVFAELASDPNRDAIAAAIFAPSTMAALLAAGLKVSGETISA